MTKTLSIIIGSTRTNRVGKAIADWTAAQAKTAGFDAVELIDLKELDLPRFDSETSPMYAPIDTPEARAWGATITDAAHLLFLTPEYNRSVPSDLKSAIDTLFEEWGSKPAAIISYGYIEGGQNAGLHLRDSLTHLKTDLVADTAAIQLTQTLVSDEAVNADEITEDTKTAVITTLSALASK